VNGVVVDDSAASDVVVAFGTSTSEIRMYSPAEDKVIDCLSGVHERGIKDFKFTAQKHGQEGWSIGGDGKLVQWDVRKSRSIRYAPDDRMKNLTYIRLTFFCCLVSLHCPQCPCRPFPDPYLRILPSYAPRRHHT
jgi:WD40 repeat protein